EPEGDAAGLTRAGLPRLLRGAVDPGPARAAAEDQEPDTRHRRPPRHGDAHCGRRADPQQDSRREPHHPGRRPHLQCRAIARLHRRGGGFSDATVILVVIPGRPERGDLWCAFAHLRISRFRVWSFGPSRNDGITGGTKWTISSAATAAWASAGK